MNIPSFTFDSGALKRNAKKPDEGTLYDLLILGGGPAAMSATIYAARKMMKIALLTKDFGGQMGYTSEIENYMGFQSVSGRELTAKFKDHIMQFEIPVHEGEKVIRLSAEGANYKVIMEYGSEYRGKSIIIATGKRDRHLNVPGENELTGRGVAYCATCDAPFFRDKKVVVVGGGNSAFTAALDLLKVNAHVTLLNFAEGWQADEIMLTHARQHGERLTLLDMHQVLEIKGSEKVEAMRLMDRRSNSEKEIAVDGVFVEIGLLPNSDFIDDGLVKHTPLKEVSIDCGARSSREFIYGAGDVTTVPYKQIIISAGEGAKAALSAYEDLTKKGLI